MPNSNYTESPEGSSKPDFYYLKLAKHLAEVQSPKEVIWLLSLLLTRSEIHAVCDRLRIYSLLADGHHSQRDIARIAQVSISTVERGASNTHRLDVRNYLSKHFPTGSGHR